MQIVLLSNVKDLGFTGDIVNVAIGYAQNFLVPRGLAEFATPTAVAEAAQKKSDRVKKHDEIVAKSEEILKSLDSCILTFTRKVSSKGKLFGGISETEVIDALRDQQKIEIDTSHVHFAHGHPKTIGDHQVDVHLCEGKHASVTLRIAAE